VDEVALYERILGLKPPWFVDTVEFDESDDAVLVYLGIDEGEPLNCPMCGRACPRYDKRRRRWRHLDTCQYQTFVIADVPRVTCEEHGCLMIEVEWAQPRSRFTAMFEALIIEWLLDSSILAVARHFRLSWTAVDGIMKRAVARGLARRKRLKIKRLGVDEISFKKRHDYVTVITNDQGHVLAVEDDRTKLSLRRFYDGLTKRQKAGIESVSMDMAPAYIEVTLEEIPEADRKIAFDKFHVAQALGKAVDAIRKQEHGQLMRIRKHDELKGVRYLWLTNSANLDREQRQRIRNLSAIAAKTGRAWALKEYAMSLWHYDTRGWAQRAWEKWLTWAMRSRLMPIIAVAKMVRDKLWGILNAIVLKADNAMAESVNSKIKALKVKARGYRNRERYKTAILFHFGGLSLHP
jgi:transposase